MKVKMLVDAPGSPDGVTVNHYGAGETYEVTADLGAVFVAEGLAEPMKRATKKAAGPTENK